MNYLKTFVGIISRFKSLKYVLVVVIAVLIVGFLDENSVWNHFRNKRTINELREEISRYQSIYESDQQQLKKLDNDPKAIEEIARERYFMKADDEDIFVLDEE